MKLLRLKVISAETCGGLLDGFEMRFRPADTPYHTFDPLCLIGPNGAGKSQLLQVLAEVFQSVLYACVPSEERRESNPDLLFELEYLIKPSQKQAPVHVRVSRDAAARRRSGPLVIARKQGAGWIECEHSADATKLLLPKKVVGYTSGDNETLSLPFLISRAEYAEEVRNAVFEEGEKESINDTRLMLIDYGTHLEVLVANLLFATEEQRNALLEAAGLKELHSCRCIVQLAHSAAPPVPRSLVGKTKRKGVQLTPELENYLDWLRRCSTCHDYDEDTETYIFDFLVTDETKKAFKEFWGGALELYTSFHKLAMLNDLVIPRDTRVRFRQETKNRRFASRLPEPQDDEKVFRFERVQFTSLVKAEVVDYVSLSDGEHQLAQLLGMLCMISFQNALFLLDEPESHFNPKWRSKCITRVLDQPTNGGTRRDGSGRSPASEQDCLLTTHSPFVPSDMQYTKVFIFRKDEGKVTARNPDIETYGATFDKIIEACFGIRPPISEVARTEIEELKASENPKTIEDALPRLGESMEKVMLTEHLRQLLDEDGK